MTKSSRVFFPVPEIIFLNSVSNAIGPGSEQNDKGTEPPPIRYPPLDWFSDPIPVGLLCL
jgi:hypothetical protein